MSGLAYSLLLLTLVCGYAAWGARQQGCERRDVFALLGFGAGAGVAAAPLLF